MKKILLLFCFAFALGPVWSQTGFPHRLKDLIVKIKADTGTGPTSLLTSAYVQNHPDSGIYYARELITYGKQNNDRGILAAGLNIYSYALYNKGNYPAALNIAFQSLKIIENSTHTRVLAGIYNQVGNIYKGQQNYPKALYYYRRSKQVALASHDAFSLGPAYFNMAFVFKETNVLDSALYYSRLAVNDNNPSTRLFMGYILSTLGDEYLKLKNYQKALGYYQAAYKLDKKNADFRDGSITCISLAKYYSLTGKPDSAIDYAQRALYSAKKVSYNKSVFESAALLAHLYEARHQPDSGFKYFKLSSIAKDSLYNAAKSGEMENLTTDELLRQNEIQAAQKAYQNKLRLYALIFGLLVLFVAALLQWHNSRQRKKAYSLLQRQKEEIEEQKAQAMIEVALERVRSRTMAMQHSDELKDVIQVIYEQLYQLNFNIDSADFNLDYRDSDDFNLWVGVPGRPYPAKMHIPYIDHPLFNRIVKAKVKVPAIIADCYTSDQKNTYFKHNFKFSPTNIPAERQDFILSGAGLAISTVLMTNVALSIMNYSGVPYANADNATLLRFGKVFEQTYTRFKDLEQAEEQAREAQIQLGLERVRARAMAMQSSGELADVVDIVFKELTRLDFGLTHCAIAIADAGSVGLTLWQANSEADQPPVSFYRKSFDHPYPNAAYKEWKKRTPKWVYHLKGAEKKAMHDYYASSQETMYVPNAVKEGMAAFDKIILSHSFNNFGYLRTDTTDPLSEDNLDIVYRFAKAFDLCYTRFTDIKQAEAQVKESQIQLALERVRARTMAMQRSEELAETATVLFQQLYSLDVTPERVFIGIPDDRSRTIELWGTEQGGTGMSTRFEAHADGAYSMSRIFEGWEDKKTDMTVFLSGEYLDEHINYVANLMHMPVRMELVQDHRILYCTYFSKGMFVVVTPDVQSEETLSVLRRFAAVFDQTYTRFLDLQRAEAQAREAQIETALERVRSRTMGMQKSDELAEVIQVIYEQLHQLNFDVDVANFAVDYKESDDLDIWIATTGQTYPAKIHIPYINNPIFNDLKKAKENGVDFFADTCTFEQKNEFFEHYFKYASRTPEERKKMIFSSPGFARSSVLTKNVVLTIFNYKSIPYTDAENELLKRFGKVFEQTYTRFNDLQQAEAQAREAKIEVGLERVRAKAMAMQTSEELNELIGTVFGELTKLDVVLTRCLIMIFDPETKASRWWMANSELPSDPMNYYVQYHEHDAYASYIKAWQQLVLKWRYTLKGKVKKTWDDFLFTETELSLLPEPVITGMKAPEQVILSASFNNFGCLTLVSLEPLSDEHFDLLLRFAKVFDMSYTRFNDLKQAEAQAREARIETSLERVRAAAMAMHDSNDVGNATALVFSELYKLGITTIRCGVCIVDGATQQMEVWSASSSQEGGVNRGAGKLDMTTHPLWIQLWNAWKQKKSSFIYELAGKELADYYNVITQAPGYHAPESYIANIMPGDTRNAKQYCNCFLFNEGCVFVFTQTPFSPEISQVLEKFTAVFGLTYRRYLDLQKAEAQAREAQIEAALERVRSKTMAMHNSADVGETVTLMFNELVKLGVDKIARCGIAIPDNNGLIELWTAKLGKDEKEEIIIGHIDTAIHPMLALLYDAWKNKQVHFEYLLEGDDLTNYITALNNYRGYPIKYEIGAWGEKQYHNDFFFHEGMVFAFTFQPLSAEIAAIFKRFAGVFGQTYRRYLDLQKAEAAAREAKIEAALERVRSKAMAMRSSGDLNDTANTVFIELRKLGVDLVRCGLGLMEKETHISTIHAATNSDEGGSLEVLGNIDMNIHPVFEGIYSQWRQNQDYFPVLEGKSLKAYYQKLHESGIAVPEWKSGEKQYGYFLQFAYGSLYAWSSKQESEITVKTLKRFTSVISLTYTRYIELQKAESNTKEAVKQASLDRVRAEIASMRKRNDLERITPLIWDELTILGIPFIRCGVFIMDEEQELIHTFLSTPDGKAIGAFHVPFDTSGNFEKMVDSWRHGVPYIDHWDEEAFSQFADTLLKQGAIASKAQYMRTLPHEGIHLNFLPFLQGMLYVGNTTPLSNDEIELVQSLADAFSTAYARYEDFNKLEAAKKVVEETLTDLKAAQTQLIQSEKMASLGELTAGIAHEIQNPLNFVNNFSEVNSELIDEMKEEIQNGNIDDGLAIADDIKENEQKISMHGKRADSIVKSMLEHSRISSGEKQLTNINALADEFIKLSYHGLRAKDKSFNAEMISHFDPELPKINLVQQDVGRVLLNLFNNAFYAVNQKRKAFNGEYKPEVTVTTLTDNGQVTIKVRDNGSGIPDPIKDKIMQPFFTTKPTGEGTGLGLSLSYDIVVKGHGGKIEVETGQGVYTEFKVTLPIS